MQIRSCRKISDTEPNLYEKRRPCPDSKTGASLSLIYINKKGGAGSRLLPANMKKKKIIYKKVLPFVEYYYTS